MSTADEIRAKVATGGVPVGGPYNEGNTSPVTVYRNDDAIVWTSGMSIDCDGQPGSACNINTDPYFQAQTAFNQSNGQPLKAEELPFVVVPLASSRWNYRNDGISGGDLVVMAYKDKHVFGVVGDLGPSARIGEGSYAAAAALGINPNPRSGGVASGVTYVVFRGVKVSPIEDKAKAAQLGAAKLAEWLGVEPGEEPPVTTPANAIDAMVSAAEADLGLGEPNYIQDWYDNKFGDLGYNWAWCNAAVTWWAHKSGNAKAVCFSDNGHFAYTVAHAEAFKSRGQWHTDTAGIQRGDIVFFDWNGSNNISAIDHVGLVVGVSGSTVQTIEGNIENACRRKNRDSSTIVGYGRPNYTSGGGSTPVPSGTVKLSEAAAKLPAPTRIIQAALNQTVDGDFGPVTTAAYKAWQQSLGWPGDGLPSAHSLYMLGKAKGFTVDLGGVKPIGPDGKDASATTPPTTPPTTPEVPVIYFEDVGARGTSAANKVVQTALNKWKSSPALAVDGDFGPVTSARYKEWQVSLYGVGPDSDGIPGVSSLTSLGKRSAYPFTVKVRGGSTTPTTPTTPPATGTPSVNDYLTVAEPAHNYNRVSYGGRTVNVRTREMLKLAASWAGVTISLTQGSYNAGGVAASAGTHDGGGAVDISVSNWSTATRTKVVVALRKAGFAAWLRTPAQGFAYHIHGIAIGDREASSGAKNQVQSYFNGRNGLANNGRDDAERRWPNWADKYNL